KPAKRVEVPFGCPDAGEAVAVGEPGDIQQQAVRCLQVAVGRKKHDAEFHTGVLCFSCTPGDKMMFKVAALSYTEYKHPTPLGRITKIQQVHTWLAIDTTCPNLQNECLSVLRKPDRSH